MKNKIVIILIALSLLILSLACNDGGGDTTTTVDEPCWQRVYNECTDAGNGVWTCNDVAKVTCSVD